MSITKTVLFHVEQKNTKFFYILKNYYIHLKH